MFGFEVFSSNGKSQLSSNNYGWVILDQWVVKPIVPGRVTSKSWVVPEEFTDFKLFVGGGNCRYKDGKNESLAGFVNGYLSTLDTYVADLSSIVTRSDGTKLIELTLREVSQTARVSNPNSYSTLVAHLVGR